MIRARSQLLALAVRLAAIGGGLGVVAGIAQAAAGGRMPDWSGDKDHPVALGLLTIALSAGALGAAQALRAATAPRDGMVVRVTAWLAIVAAVCSTTVGRLWVVPGVLLFASAGLLLTACGWHRFRSEVAGVWGHGLLAILGGFELLMAASAAPTVTVAAGIVAGGALVAAAVAARPGRLMAVSGLVAATLPFAVLTWWAVIPPLLTTVAFGVGVAATRGTGSRRPSGGVAPLDLQPVG